MSRLLPPHSYRSGNRQSSSCNSRTRLPSINSYINQEYILAGTSPSFPAYRSLTLLEQVGLDDSRPEMREAYESVGTASSPLFSSLPLCNGIEKLYLPGRSYPFKSDYLTPREDQPRIKLPSLRTFSEELHLSHPGFPATNQPRPEYSNILESHNPHLPEQSWTSSSSSSSSRDSRNRVFTSSSTLSSTSGSTSLSNQILDRQAGNRRSEQYDYPGPVAEYQNFADDEGGSWEAKSAFFESQHPYYSNYTPTRGPTSQSFDDSQQYPFRQDGDIRGTSRAPTMAGRVGEPQKVPRIQVTPDSTFGNSNGFLPDLVGDGEEKFVPHSNSNLSLSAREKDIILGRWPVTPITPSNIDSSPLAETTFANDERSRLDFAARISAARRHERGVQFDFAEKSQSAPQHSSSTRKGQATSSTEDGIFPSFVDLPALEIDTNRTPNSSSSSFNFPSSINNKPISNLHLTNQVPSSTPASSIASPDPHLPLYTTSNLRNDHSIRSFPIQPRPPRTTTTSPLPSISHQQKP
ncbi:hypothetical protein P7C70_g9032, partial [Phenoliferia sp. Uapishka_3]